MKMYMKLIRKSKQAISPILATLLLVVLVVAAIVATYTWVMTYTSSATEQAGVLLRKDAVNWQSAPSKIVVYVRNVGTSDSIMDAVYIGLSSTDLVPQENVTYDPTSAVVLKNGGTIAITVDYGWSAQTTYYFKIAPKVGEALVFHEKAP
jgi:flagellin-like protein